jgi:5'-nucleotidase
VQDDTLVLQVTSAQLLLCLENGVSMYPKLEGRFLQVHLQAVVICWAPD